MNTLDALCERVDERVVAVGGFAITAVFGSGTDDPSWRRTLCGWMDQLRSTWSDRLGWAFDAQRERWIPNAKFPPLRSCVVDPPMDRGFEFQLHSGAHPEDAATWSLGCLAEHQWQGASGFVRVETPASWVAEVGADRVAAMATELWALTGPTHGWASFSVHRPMAGGLAANTAACRWVQEHIGLQLDEPISLLSMRPSLQVLAGSWLTFLGTPLAARCAEIGRDSTDALQITNVGPGIVLRAGTEPVVDVQEGSPTHQALSAAARALKPVRMVRDPSWYPAGNGRLTGEQMEAWLHRFDG